MSREGFATGDKTSGDDAQELQAVRAAKAAARQQVKSRLKQLSAEAMAQESRQVCQAVLSSEAFARASKVAVYLHCARLKEVDTNPIVEAALAAGKRCYVPMVEDQSANMKLLHLDSMSAVVSVPPFGILEPRPAYEDGKPREDVVAGGVHLDLLLMPGLGFDAFGRRLGRGGGYYDTMLARLQQQATEAGRQPPLLVALAYTAQLLDKVPVDSHDQAVDVLVTAQGTMHCSERGREAWS